jgi:hypothetical protein
MGPRFDTPLDFECDGALEICGPTGFGPDDVLLEITQLVIRQGNVSLSPPHLPIITVAPKAMWETSIPGARAAGLTVGAASGAAVGFVVKRGGGRVEVPWPGVLMLEDGCAVLKDVLPGSEEVRAAYLAADPAYGA